MSRLRTFPAALHASQGLGSPTARIAVGLLFFLSGRGKFLMRERREQMRRTLMEAHVPFPRFHAVFVSAVEFGCGLLLIIGVLMPLACAMHGCIICLRES